MSSRKSDSTSIVSVPFLSGQSMFLDDKLGEDQIRFVSVPFLSGQSMFRAEDYAFVHAHACFSPLLIGAVNVSHLDGVIHQRADVVSVPFLSGQSMFRLRSVSGVSESMFQSPSYRGSQCFSRLLTERFAHTRFQSPSYRGSQCFCDLCPDIGMPTLVSVPFLSGQSMFRAKRIHV